ncbi:solute carrier family 25 (mitochondrial carrier; oxoglutarate carrier), member 11, isoform CRA_a [Homo sapiens]|uniref:Mitochondrial 2-oxoglutarate/malate carrier protein n=1 Tax=Gorilla gorilla gorilla TaxID=9595 RepID=A0A2I2Y9B4_GORGO|nr:solute carrier family 25 (mitochondrial carrier; oxoglutarate carrier), member 11, isoform CRA_a [Homo sapiens]|eukprot:XP_024306762.1 mitochondrial 2-oxoglutarate/malate carrier protein isoform X1 [Homo sapiens]
MAATASAGAGGIDGKPRTSPKSVKFLFGGLAGMGATVFVQPLDLVKNRMQLSGEGAKTREYKTSFHALTSILKAEGLRGIYTGYWGLRMEGRLWVGSSRPWPDMLTPLLLRLSAGLLRQATYTTTRLGIYTVLFERLTGADGTPPGFLLKAVIGMTAGATGAFVGTPAEVALIRMTADGRLPADQRRGYKNVFNALIRITREEGVLTLWRGCIPTMARAVVVNAAQLASYSQSKQFLLDSGYFSDNILCHFCASMISGLVTTAASMPVDIAKTRIQNMRMIDGKPEYKNGLDVLFKVVRYEGFFSLWKGFTPYYARLGPHTVLTFIFLEQMNKAYKRLFLSG